MSSSMNRVHAIVQQIQEDVCMMEAEAAQQRAPEVVHYLRSVLELSARAITHMEDVDRELAEKWKRSLAEQAEKLGVSEAKEAPQRSAARKPFDRKGGWQKKGEPKKE